jgi:sensor histidine kinase regulating citrate/malate metabolism
MDNTRKYGQKATYARIYHAIAKSGILHLIYEDDGTGILPENKSLLFREGFSTGGSTGFGYF